MKISDMSEINNLRSTTRTPNIFQQNVESISSPTPSTKLVDNTLSPSGTPSTTTKSMQSLKIQTLKQRKLDLDKLLIEKNNLLQQLCRDEVKLLGSSYSMVDIKTSGIDCNDGVGGNGDGYLVSNTALRRRVDTGFKLPENLLNSKEDDINQLLLSKQIQQQISQASLKLANDVSQTKSIRRAHKQNYDVAQQKIQSINQSLSMLKKCPNIEMSEATSDDINIHYNKFSCNNNNLTNNNINSMVGLTTANNVIKNYNNSKVKHHSGGNSILNNNNNNIENNISAIPPERRNSAISVGSASQYLLTSANAKTRSRCDSYSGGIPINTEFSSSNSEKLLASPTATTGIYYYRSQQQQPQHPHLHYSNHNHLADKVVYVTNAVVNAAAAAAAASNPNNSLVVTSSPKYGRLRKPLTVDTSVSEPYYYPPSGGTSSTYHQHRPNQQQQYFQQQQRHSPYSKSRMHLTPNMTHTNAAIENGPVGLNVISTQAFDDDDDDDDDIAGQYATLLSLAEQQKKFFDTQQSSEIDNNDQETDTHYSEIVCRKQPLASMSVVGNEQAQTKDDSQSKNQGLGGYWMTTENNERIWYALDNRYSSLDRKSQKNKLKKQIARNANHPTKSTSLGNFNFLNKQDELLDAISITSTTSPRSEQRRYKEKEWVETSLDGPPTPTLEYNSSVPQLISPPIYYRDKNRLSSQSMHSPNRNAISMGIVPTTTATTTTSASTTSKPCMLQLPLNKSLSTSATTLSSTDIVINTNQQQQPISPPYYHPQVQQKTSPSIRAPDTSTPFLDSSNSYANISSSSDIHIESPKNVTIVQPAKFQPYKEETKPFEMSDFYKYSTKFRQKNPVTTNIGRASSSEHNSPQLPPKNVAHHRHHHRHMHSNSLNANLAARSTTPTYSIQQ